MNGTSVLVIPSGNVFVVASIGVSFILNLTWRNFRDNIGINMFTGGLKSRDFILDA